jgi:Predicted membrane protein (DUF2232)
VPPAAAPRGRGAWRVAAAAALLGLFAPLGLIALPLAALLLLSRPSAPRDWLVVGISVGVAAAWLAGGAGLARTPGEAGPLTFLVGTSALSDQLLRAAAVIATAVFVVASLGTGLRFVHRVILALAIQAVAVSLLLRTAGSSWSEMVWWVEHDWSLALRSWIAGVWTASGTGSNVGAEFEAGIRSTVQAVSRLYPAVVALQIFGGLAVASAVYHRVCSRPVIQPLGRFRDFRFSEHLGWAAVIPLALMLLPRLTVAKFAAQNVVVVAAALYALRGAAVAAFGIGALGSGATPLLVVLALLGVLLLPLVLGGAILLGVLDAGLDLRRRWRTPRVRDSWK